MFLNEKWNRDFSWVIELILLYIYRSYPITPMWHFIIQQDDLSTAQYQALQKKAALTEVEPFNEPHPNLCVFDVERENYPEFVDYLDLEGIRYETVTLKPTREQLRNQMQ